MKPRKLPLLLAIAILGPTPSLVLAQDGVSIGNLGATRVPREVRALQSAQADPYQPDSMYEAGDSRGDVPGRVIGSRSLGSGKKDPSARRIESTAESLSAPGGVLGMDSQAGESKETITAAPTGGPVPELHVVAKGDTLWSLCSRYFGDPWRWPRLWAANPVITNPHWIFPGDVIRLGEGGGAMPLAPSEPAEAPRSGMTSVNRVGAERGNAVLLRELGFIESRDLEQAGTISGSREEKIMLTSGDQAYLIYPEKHPLRAGERYSVFETDTDHPVIDATSGKTYGYLVRIQGDLIVNQIAENNIARATLVDTAQPIERGARVSAFVRQFKRIEPRPSNVTLEARVITTFEPNILLGHGHFVILNRGKKDGVQVGNRTFVIRRGDGYRATLEAWEKHDPSMPREVVAEILVVDVRDNASVAWIARSSKELKVGEITEMRKGY
ncbi:MAG: LysM peptidoglycan-binding domain-containing protein [Deltaproteobacteria bacterium]|nr:LysM peptidoglycan-binding domain-containing protein [Deltaproteobacteria bacterium]